VLLKNALLAPLKHALLVLLKKKIKHENTASPVPLKEIGGCHWKNRTAPLAPLKNALLAPLNTLCWCCWKKIKLMKKLAGATEKIGLLHWHHWKMLCWHRKKMLIEKQIRLLHCSAGTTEKIGLFYWCCWKMLCQPHWKNLTAPLVLLKKKSNCSASSAEKKH